VSKSTRKLSSSKPHKPTKEFPRFPHATGGSAKKVRGKLQCFGKVDGDEKPLFRHLETSRLAHPPVSNAKATPSGRKATVWAAAMRNAGYVADKVRTCVFTGGSRGCGPGVATWATSLLGRHQPSTSEPPDGPRRSGDWPGPLPFRLGDVGRGDLALAGREFVEHGLEAFAGRVSTLTWRGCIDELLDKRSVGHVEQFAAIVELPVQFADISGDARFSPSPFLVVSKRRQRNVGPGIDLIENSPAFVEQPESVLRDARDLKGRSGGSTVGLLNGRRENKLAGELRQENTPDRFLIFLPSFSCQRFEHPCVVPRVETKQYCPTGVHRFPGWSTCHV